MNDSMDFAAATLGTPNQTVTSSFPALATAPFQQLPGTATALYGSSAGFAVQNKYVTVPTTSYSLTGYNALTGLGSPNVGAISGGAQLAAYLAAQARVPIPRIYMVAESAIVTNTYWLGSFAYNPYVQNLPVYTQWYQLSSQQLFSGPPALVDDGDFAGGGAGAGQNLLILGPSTGAASAFSVIQWNINTQTATVLPLAGATFPSNTSGNTNCSSITAFTNATTTNIMTRIGVYCLTSAGNVYATNINTFTGNANTGYTGATEAAWTSSPILSNVSSAPHVAQDNTAGAVGSANYEVVLQTIGTSYNVVYTQTPIAGFNNTGANGAPSMGSLLTEQSSCNSTPAIAYVVQTAQYQIACIARDTHAMWANFYSAASTVRSFSNVWTLLGQPSSSVTFLPGDAVAVDNIASDPGYGLVFYIAEASDTGMYLSVVNGANSNFLFNYSNWQIVSLKHIFSSGASASFEYDGGYVPA